MQEPLHDPREVHLRNIRQLTFSGKNAEAYFSFAEDMLCFQATPPRLQLRPNLYHGHNRKTPETNLPRLRTDYVCIFSPQWSSPLRHNPPV